MYKKLKRKEFEEFSKKLEFKEDGKLPFFDYCEKYFKILGCETHLNLHCYIAFLTMYLEKYKNEVCLGELNFNEFLNKEFSFEVVEETSDLEQLDDYLRANFLEEDVLTVKEVMKFVDAFRENEVKDGK